MRLCKLVGVFCGPDKLAFVDSTYTNGVDVLTSFTVEKLWIAGFVAGRNFISVPVVTRRSSLLLISS